MMEETTYSPVTSPVGDIDPHTLGMRGEEAACNYLIGKGWEILERNWRSDYGEVDIVARDPEEPSFEVVFIEVKTRRGKNRDDIFPEEAVDFEKRGRYRNAAENYLQLHEWAQRPRFDVVGITAYAEGRARLRHNKRAFGMEY